MSFSGWTCNRLMVLLSIYRRGRQEDGFPDETPFLFARGLIARAFVDPVTKQVITSLEGDQWTTTELGTELVERLLAIANENKS